MGLLLILLLSSILTLSFACHIEFIIITASYPSIPNIISGLILSLSSSLIKSGYFVKFKFIFRPFKSSFTKIKSLNTSVILLNA